MNQEEIDRRLSDYIDTQLPLFSSETGEDGKRHYVTPSGFRYPSVTTVISAMSDHTWLDKWRERLGPEKADEIRRAAAHRGTTMHDLIERTFRGEPLPEKTEDNKLGFALFKGLRIYLAKVDPLVMELPLYSDKLKVAGKTDCIGYYDGELSIIDFKSSRTEKAENQIHNYFVQEAMYSMAAMETLGIKCKQIVTLISCEFGFPQVFRRKTNDYIEDAIHIARAYHSVYGNSS